MGWKIGWKIRVGRLGLAAALVATSLALYDIREWFVQEIYVPGAGGAPAPALNRPDDPALAGRGLTSVDRVRVVLIDGLGAYDADRLGSFTRSCQKLRLTVDMGFPTISLPVQRALWTGLTQQQTGVQFFNRLIDPPAVDIPGQVADSRAVSESHQYIAHSFGFAHVLPGDPWAIPDEWNLKTSWRSWLSGGRAKGFERAALEAVTSDTRLAFVHILRVDTIAHKRGVHAPEYRSALTWADKLLGKLLDKRREVPPRGVTRWFVIADHGHRAGGGHGGPEPHIRKVTMCVADITDAERAPSGAPDGAAADASRPAPVTGSVYLPDISRAIADSLGVRVDPQSAGRPLHAALAARYEDGATSPTPAPIRWLVAVLTLLLSMGATVWAARSRWWNLPWWLPVAYGALIYRVMPPSMSTSWAFKPGGAIIYDAALPAFLVLAVFVAYAVRRAGVVRATIAQLAIPLAALAAAFTLCWGTPPVMPRFTALTSVFLVFTSSGALIAAVACAVGAVFPGSDRDTSSE